MTAQWLELDRSSVHSGLRSAALSVSPYHERRIAEDLPGDFRINEFSKEWQVRAHASPMNLVANLVANAT